MCSYYKGILRKAKSKKWRLYLENNSKVNPSGDEVLKYIINLALLPENDIAEGISIVKDVIKTLFHARKESALYDKLMKFVTSYVEGYWVKKITPAVLSVFWKADRTNNPNESKII